MHWEFFELCSVFLEDRPSVLYERSFVILQVVVIHIIVQSTFNIIIMRYSSLMTRIPTVYPNDPTIATVVLNFHFQARAVGSSSKAH
jgi:hypothetical protein